jgi:hypothetical protein
MDPTPQRLHESELMGLDSASMLAACHLSFVVVFHLTGWLINDLLHLFRLYKTEWQDVCEWCFLKGVFRGIYEQSQSKLVDLWAETGTRGLRNTKQEFQKPRSVFVFIPRKCLPHVRLTQPADHFEISCWEADPRIISYILETVVSL